MFNQPYVDGSNQPGENLAVVSVDSATHGVLAFWKGNNIHSDLPLELFFVACFSMFLQSLYHFLHHFSIILYPTPCFGCFYSLVFVGWKTKVYSFHPLRACRAFAVLLEEPERM
jgi:hypothetical protein